MATFSKSTSVEMTATGKRKIQQIERAVLRATQGAMVRMMPRYKRLLASFSPSASDEAQLLSEGTIFEGRYVSRGPRKGELEASRRMVGTPRGGRFLRNAPMRSLRRAIADSEVRVTASGTRVTVTTARAAELNQMTGFSWRTKRRGVQGPTLPYDRRYVQALEDGGAWEVRRRTPALLNPEPGVFAGRMIKTLEPWGMYRRARVAIREPMKAAIAADVKRALKGLQ